MGERDKVETWTLATCTDCSMPFGREFPYMSLCPFCFKEKSNYQILKGDLAFAFLQKELHKKQSETSPAAAPASGGELEAEVLKRRLEALRVQLEQSQKANEDLRREVGRLRVRASVTPGSGSSTPDLSLLRKMVVLCHPDKHRDSPIATEVTQWINAQMDKVRR